MDNILELKNVRKKYKGFLLDDVSIKLPPGYTLGIIGPNGAGKTTMIKIMMDMVKADGGEVKIFGKNHRKFIKEIKNRIGYVGEEPSFYEDKTVAWTGKFVSEYFDRWDSNTFQNYITKFDISRSKKIRELSKGMKVKLALALALSHNPELIVLDEPTAGLDPVVRRELLEILRKIPEEGDKSVIICSHITDDIARIADYVSFLVDGRIVLSEAKDELLAKWKRIHYQYGALNEEIINKLFNRKEQMFGSSGMTSIFPEIQESLEKGITADKIKIENIGLDDILIAYVKENGKCGRS